MANKKLSAVVTIGGAIASSLKSAFGQTQAGVVKIGQALKDAEKKQRDLTHAMTYGSARAAEAAQKELAVINKQVEALKRKHAASKIGAARSQMAGAGIALGATAVAATPLLAAAKNAAEFEYQLRMIGNTANMTDGEIQALGATITKAGIKTGQSTDEIVKAMGFLIAAGLDAKTAAGLLDQIGKTATATGADIEDLSKAAFVLNDTLKIKPGQAMAEALDTLAQAGKEGNVELRDMAKQLPVLGSGFVSLKMEGREAAATMAAALEVARKGAADADEAANNMKNYIAKIMSPETLKKAKKNFNIDLYSIIKNAQSKGENPFEASMQAIMKATKGDQKAIGELFQDMQVQNFIRPMIQNWDEYTRIKNNALNAKGVIDKDFSSVLGTSKQQMNEFSNATDRASKSIGDVFKPALGAALSILTPVVNSVSEFITNNSTLVGNVAAVVVSFGTFFAATKVLALGLGVVTFAFNALKLAFLTNPIGIAIGLLATAAFMIYKNWEPIKDFFAGIWNGIVDGAKAAFQWVMDKLAVIGQYWDKFKSFFGNGTMGGKAPDMPSPALPSLPAMATAGGQNTSVHQTNSFQIFQQPGQDNKSLTDEIMRKIKEQDAVKNRGMMYDHALGY